MKKFYTMMGIAALGLTMSAIAAPQMQVRAESQGELIETTRAKIESIQSLNRTKTCAAKETAKEIKAADILGDYQHDEYHYTEASIGTTNGLSYPLLEAGSGENEVNISGLWVGFDDSGVPNGSFTATFDPQAKTLSIPAGAKLGSVTASDAFGNATTTDYYMFIQDYHTHICSADPIVLTYDPTLCQFKWTADGMDTNNYTENIVITTEPDCAGKAVETAQDFVFMLQLSRYNSEMTIIEGGSPCAVRIVPVPENNTFSVYNFGGMGFVVPLTFDVNSTEKTVNAPRTLWSENVGNIADVYFASPTGDSITGTYTVEVDNGKTVSRVSLDDWTLWTTEFGAFTDTYANSGIDVPFDLDNMTGTGVGVENVAVDTDADDVVYYNLQGVKVLNPAPGQLVIARHGGKAVKMFAK